MSQKQRMQSIPIISHTHILSTMTGSTTKPEITEKPYEDMDQYQSYHTSAIPRKKTELNYKMAMNRQLHSKNKKYLQTRRDLTIKHI
jgi:hypothetical protein